MTPNKPAKLDGKHPEAARDVLEDIKDRSGDRHPMHSELRYMEPNRDRALGDTDRTGRHFDADAAAPDEGSEASEEHEAD